MKIFILSLFLLLEGCISTTGAYFNTIVDCQIVVLDKRYIPGFQNPDRYQFKVLEEDEYIWVNTTESMYNKIQKNDTINTTLIFTRN